MIEVTIFCTVLLVDRWHAIIVLSMLYVLLPEPLSVLVIIGHPDANITGR